MKVEIKYRSSLLSIPNVQKVVENYFVMDSGELTIKTRKHEIVLPRQLAHYWCVEHKLLYHWSLSQIGGYLGGVDHATVLHSHKTINHLIDTKYIYQGVLISDHVKHIKDDINAYITKKHEKAMAAEAAAKRTTTGAIHNNQVLPFYRVAQNPKRIHNIAPALRRMFTESKNRTGTNGRPYSANKQRIPVRHSEREIWRAVRMAKPTIVMQ